jgi:hypothetical protein
MGSIRLTWYLVMQRVSCSSRVRPTMRHNRARAINHKCDWFIASCWSEVTYLGILGMPALLERGFFHFSLPLPSLPTSFSAVALTGLTS